jgi:hypothetical protein
MAYHDKCAAEPGRGTLGGKDGRSRRLGADAEAKEEASDEHVVPVVGEGLPEAGQGTDEARDEHGPSTAKVPVHGVGDPAADHGAAQVGGAVDKTDEPGVPLAGRADAKVDFVEDLGAVDYGLVHALNGGA